MDGVFATAISVLTAAGLGGAVGAYFQARFQQRGVLGQQEHELKQKRYLCILILMLTKLRPDVGLPKMAGHRPDLRNAADVDDELATELMNGFVFAADQVLESLAAFIRNPSHATFVQTAVAMRKDLWNSKTSVSEELLRTLEASIGGPRDPA